MTHVGYPPSRVERERDHQAIYTVRPGGSALDARLADTLIIALKAPSRAGTTLSKREFEVLCLLARGFANKQIAQALVIRERTVKFHVTSICNKLGADNRAQAVALAAQRKLIYVCAWKFLHSGLLGLRSPADTAILYELTSAYIAWIIHGPVHSTTRRLSQPPLASFLSA